MSPYQNRRPSQPAAPVKGSLPRVGVLLVRVGTGVAARNAAGMTQSIFVDELRGKANAVPIKSGIAFSQGFPLEVRGDAAKLCQHYKVDYLLVSEVGIAVEGSAGVTVTASLNRDRHADWHGTQLVRVAGMSKEVDREIQRNASHPARRALQTAIHKLVAEMAFPK